MSEIELNLIPILCNSDYNSIDIGAYKGEYTKIMSQYSKIVYGFEPVLRRYTELSKKRFIKNGNVKIHQIALSNNDKIKEINIPHFKNRFHKDYALDVMSSIENSVHEYYSEKNKMYLGIEKIFIQTRTLDSFKIEDVAFIKIDVEGHELSVLSGAKNTIIQYLPHMLIEIEQRHIHHEHNKVNTLLNKLGYEGYFIYDKQLLPYKEFDITEMQIKPLEKIKHRPTSNIPDYINNFLFFHKSKDIAEIIKKLII
ncbi:MAG: FkbM family methyltransferase [Candidatus Woesearchaeota archaeon]